MSHFIDLWAAAAMLCGLGYIAWVYFRQSMVRRSRSWPTTTGTVVRSELNRSTSLTGPSRTPNRTFGARIEYNYMVGTRVYRGTTISVGGTFDTSSNDRAQEWLDKYPLGATVTVSYDPTHPEICCLEHSHEAALFGYLIGAVFALLGLLVLLDVIPVG